MLHYGKMLYYGDFYRAAWVLAVCGRRVSPAQQTRRRARVTCLLCKKDGYA